MDEHTFVIPVYNESPYLEDCIKSLLGQTVKSKVIITTSTPSVYIENIAAAYHIPYIINHSGQTGIANDWNFALANANAKLVTIAHQDDIYDPQFFEIVSKRIKAANTKNLSIAFTKYANLVNGKTRRVSLNSLVKKTLLLPFAFKRSIGVKFLKKAVLLFGNPICCPSVTLNMEGLPDFKFETNYQYVLDWYAWYELARHDGAFMFINKTLIQHRIHTGSETTAQLNNGIRKGEEQQIFGIIWGKSIAKIIACVYTLGHKGNITSL